MSWEPTPEQVDHGARAVSRLWHERVHGDYVGTREEVEAAPAGILSDSLRLQLGRDQGFAATTHSADAGVTGPGQRHRVKRTRNRRGVLSAGSSRSGVRLRYGRAG